MKKYSLILIMILLLSVVSVSTGASAQAIDDNQKSDQQQILQKQQAAYRLLSEQKKIKIMLILEKHMEVHRRNVARHKKSHLETIKLHNELRKKIKKKRNIFKLQF